MWEDVDTSTLNDIPYLLGAVLIIFALARGMSIHEMITAENSWETATAIVVDVEEDYRIGMAGTTPIGMYYYTTTYEYEVNDTSYFGTTNREAEVGEDIKIYYNPDKPEQSVLSH